MARLKGLRDWLAIQQQRLAAGWWQSHGYLGRHLAVWQAAWQNRHQQPTLDGAGSKELEFLPAVLEVQESPPSPAGRIVVYLILTLFLLAIIWASLGHMDIVAVAQGKIIPSDRSKVIQPLESGVIKQIHVRDGQQVKQGDVLLELDTSSTGADRERLANEHLAALTDAARLRALLADDEKTFVPPEGADAAYIANQRRQLSNQLAEHRALQDQVKAYKKLLDKKLVAKLQYLEIEGRRAEKAQGLAAALATAETRAHSLSKELSKAETRRQQQTLLSPISGRVQQLAVHTVGGVVTPAQELMVIVPQEGQLEVEAWIENKDIGFVDPEQKAEIKIEAFPFTKYGIVDGEVLSLSMDAVPMEKAGLLYAARVSMSKSIMQVGNKNVRLVPGMNVTVEVKTGKRRMIEYFLSPLLRAAKESIRER